MEPADTKLFTTYGRNNKNSGFKAWHDYVGGGSSIKIDGDYLYYITDDNYFNIVHKIMVTHLIIFSLIQQEEELNQLVLELGTSVPAISINTSDDKTLDYYQIFLIVSIDLTIL